MQSAVFSPSPCASVRLSKLRRSVNLASVVPSTLSAAPNANISVRKGCWRHQVVRASAFDQAENAVKEVIKSVDPSKGEPPSMKGKTVVITGGNSGLGYETGKVLSKAGARVILCSRDSGKGDKAAAELQQEAQSAGQGGSVEMMQIDLANLKSVHDFGEKLNSQNIKIDVLYNNAGTFVPEDQTTVDGLEIIVGTNHFGPWYLTQLLIPAMNKGGRIVWTTSPSETQTPDIDFDNLAGVGKQSNLGTYGTTKLFNIMCMKEFHKRLASSGIESFAAQPGIAKTRIFDKIAADPGKPAASVIKAGGPVIGQSVEEGARGMIYAGTNPEMAGKGGDVEHIVGPFYSGLPGGKPYGMGNIANVGNTGERPAQNERAYDDSLSTKLYERTGEILSDKISSFDKGRQWL